MDKEHFTEMIQSLDDLENEGVLRGQRIYLFGHCDATEKLADELLHRGIRPVAILDNNSSKHGRDYRGIEIVQPTKIMEGQQEDTLVCVVARAYAQMSTQLKRMGYQGQIRKLVDYNSYADYSLSRETILRMQQREQEGEGILANLKAKYPNHLLLLCPFCALGDIYIMMSYLPAFLQKRNVTESVIGVVGNACAEVVKLFGVYPVEVFQQKVIDKAIQAALFTNDEQVFIPHQDRPYVVDLFRALYVKRITLEQMYCCGVFGLQRETRSILPNCFAEYPKLYEIKKGKSVILSPYAKSVTALPEALWDKIVGFYTDMGYECYTNVVGDEKPLHNTKSISPKISEIKSLVEYAGTFVGIRSGLCDVLRTAKAHKIALYSDYNYCDTKWKAIDIYAIDGWDNRVVTKEEFP